MGIQTNKQIALGRLCPVKGHKNKKLQNKQNNFSLSLYIYSFKHMIASLNPKQLYIVFPKSTKDENFPNQPQDSYICQNQAKSINQKSIVEETF